MAPPHSAQAFNPSSAIGCPPEELHVRPLPSAAEHFGHWRGPPGDLITAESFPRPASGAPRWFGENDTRHHEGGRDILRYVRGD
jgi:hypothetical protein